MKKDTVLFDLGGTLAYYYEMPEFADLLRRGIAEVQEYLLNEGSLARSSVHVEKIARRVGEKNHEAKDHCVLRDQMSDVARFRWVEVGLVRKVLYSSIEEGCAHEDAQRQ